MGEKQGMSKGQALGWAIGTTGFGILGIMTNVGICMVALIPALVLWVVWYTKFDRDNKLMQASNDRYVAAPLTSPLVQPIPPTQTIDSLPTTTTLPPPSRSRGSQGLFIPGTPSDHQ